MKIRSLILFIIFSLFLISCESKDKWINPYDSKADQSETAKVCEKNQIECGKADIDYQGVTLEIDCGKCSDGYECRFNSCWDINECDDPALNDCPQHSDCNNLDMESDGQPYECICKENYSGNNCVPDSRKKDCTGLPANAEWNSVSSITQTWNGTEWQPSNSGTFNETPSTSECRFKCKENYDWTGSACKADTRTANCTGLPANAEWNTASSIEQTWNGEEWTPSSEGTFNPSKSSTECHFKCKNNFEWNGSECVGKTQTANCTGLPENAVWNTVSEITQTWNGTEWLPTTTGSYNETASETKCRFKCKENYDWSGSKCVAATQETDCTGKPENAVWNTADSITQTWNGSAWIPSATGSYNEESSSEECRFKCEPEYIWFSSQCIIPVSPCDPNPCGSIENSTGSCTISDTTYICECDANYNWSASTKKCDAATQEADCSPKPDNSVWNDNGANGKFEQTWTNSGWSPTNYASSYSTIAGICKYKCDSGYDWNGSLCVSPCDSNPCNGITHSTGICTVNGTSYICGCDSGYTWKDSQCKLISSVLPECSKSSDTPCYDSSSGIIWSAKASETMSWQNAIEYCEVYSEEGLSGWVLPDIDELRTILIATKVLTSCKVSETNNCLSFYECWSCSKCYEKGLQEGDTLFCIDEGGQYNDGRYNKFGDNDIFWSSSLDDADLAWTVDFSSGGVDYYPDSRKSQVRCVIPKKTKTPCDHPNPCNNISNSTGVCTVSGTTYVCNCKTASEWNGSDCVVNSTNLPECSKTSAIPCKDSKNKLAWSKRSENTMAWQDAVNYCSNYTEGGLSGWHLPNINELRTLIQNCPGSQTGGSCTVKDPDCLANSCRSDDCHCEEKYTNGGYYSKLGDDDDVDLWSSSVQSGNSVGAWHVDFYSGYVSLTSKSSTNSVRCVRN